MQFLGRGYMRKRSFLFKTCLFLLFRYIVIGVSKYPQYIYFGLFSPLFFRLDNSLVDCEIAYLENYFLSALFGLSIVNESIGPFSDRTKPTVDTSEFSQTSHTALTTMERRFSVVKLSNRILWLCLTGILSTWTVEGERSTCNGFRLFSEDSGHIKCNSKSIGLFSEYWTNDAARFVRVLKMYIEDEMFVA